MSIRVSLFLALCCAVAWCQDSRPAGLDGVTLEVDGKPVTLRSALVFGDDAVNVLILSTEAKPKEWDVLPGETRVLVLVRKEWELPKTAKIQKLADAAALLHLWGDKPQAPGTPDFAGAILLTNTSEKRWDPEEDEIDYDKASATEGTVTVKEQAFKKSIHAEFEITFPNAKVKGEAKATGKR